MARVKRLRDTNKVALRGGEGRVIRRERERETRPEKKERTEGSRIGGRRGGVGGREGEWNG